AQQLHRVLHVLFAIIENGLLAIFAPAVFGDGLGNRRLVDVFPTFDPIRATGVGEALALSPSHLARGIRQQDVAGGEVGSVKVKDVYRKWPVQNYETGQLGPWAVGDEKRVGADVERRDRAELSAPQPDGAYVLEELIQHVHDHAQHARKSARLNLVFEVTDADRNEVLAHDSDCLAPILRSSAGWSSVSIMRPAKARAMSSPSDCFGHSGSRKASGSFANVIL